MQRWLPLIAGALALSACAAGQSGIEPIARVDAPQPDPAWRAEVTAQDAARITALPATWQAALSAVPRRYAPMVAKEGDLMVPDAGREHPAPPPGSYRCRLVKIGPAARREPPVRSFPDFFCYVRAEANGGLSFAKQTGTELPGGWLHPDNDRRLVLVGARQHEAGETKLAYGAEPERDVIGVVERIGPFRWRLTLPWREGRPGLDLYEMTPVPVEQQAEEPRVPSDVATAAPAPSSNP